MYVIVATRTQDGASSVYGPFETESSAERWAADNVNDRIGEFTFSWMACPVLSTNTARRRGQMAFARGTR